MKLKSIKRKINEEKIVKSSNKNKAIWSIINNERALRNKGTDIVKWQLDISGKLVEDANQVADGFNLFFSTIADETIKANNPPMSNVVAELFLATIVNAE